jgi:amino-acid N-acetyltransferase
MMQGDDARLAGEVAIRRAGGADLEVVLRLLAASELPGAGVAEWLPHFILAESDGVVIGAAGIELYGASALLRSVVVAASWKGRGVGGVLVDRAAAHAVESGASDIYLLTTTAEHWFPRHGFHPIERSAVPEALQESVEFKQACPASAAVMVKTLSAA